MLICTTSWRSRIRYCWIGFFSQFCLIHRRWPRHILVKCSPWSQLRSSSSSAISSVPSWSKRHIGFPHQFCSSVVHFCTCLIKFVFTLWVCFSHISSLSFWRIDACERLHAAQWWVPFSRWFSGLTDFVYPRAQKMRTVVGVKSCCVACSKDVFSLCLDTFWWKCSSWFQLRSSSGSATSSGAFLVETIRAFAMKFGLSP